MISGATRLLFFFYSGIDIFPDPPSLSGNPGIGREIVCSCRLGSMHQFRSFIRNATSESTDRTWNPSQTHRLMDVGVICINVLYARCFIRLKTNIQRNNDKPLFPLKTPSHPLSSLRKKRNVVKEQLKNLLATSNFKKVTLRDFFKLR